MSCTREGCFKIVENRDLGLCATHNKERRTVKKVKEKKPVKKVSDKMKSLIAIYDKLRIPWLRGKKCKVKKCKNDADDVHHMRGRTGSLLLDTQWWLPVCRGCHHKITVDSKWAIEEGYSYSRNKKME